MTDPIGDMLTRIRNANHAQYTSVDVPASRMKVAIADILKKEGYIKDYKLAEENSHKMIKITLEYDENRKGKMAGIKRISKPGLRVYVKKTEIPRVLGGLGTVILSTPKGVMAGKQAEKEQLGGEVICYVW